MKKTKKQLQAEVNYLLRFLSKISNIDNRLNEEIKAGKLSDESYYPYGFGCMKADAYWALTNYESEALIFNETIQNKEIS